MRAAALLLALALPAGSWTRPTAPDLAAAISGAAGAKGPAWIAWEVPAADADFHSCCFSTIESLESGAPATGRCFLERDGSWTTSRGGFEGSMETAAGSRQAVVVLVRVADGAVQRVRAVSNDCPVDAGSVPVRVLTDVKPAVSVAYLASLVRAEGTGKSTRDGALHALSLHADASAVPALVALARRDPSDRVRGQALFWLAQRAGREAAGTITEAIASDPETEVKEKAVFALSQLPKDEGVPLLIDVARKNRNPAVRRRAMFWLGQSKDPRALGFIEEVLLR